MRWRHRKEEEPPRKPILVMGICGMPHVADYQHDNYCNTETCNETGWHLNGPELVFMYWMPLEELPEIPKKPEMQRTARHGLMPISKEPEQTFECKCKDLDGECCHCGYG